MQTVSEKDTLRGMSEVYFLRNIRKLSAEILTSMPVNQVKAAYDRALTAKVQMNLLISDIFLKSVLAISFIFRIYCANSHDHIYTVRIARIILLLAQYSRRLCRSKIC